MQPEQFNSDDESKTGLPDQDVLDPSDDFEGNPPSAAETLRYFGADFDVDGLVRRLDNDDFVVPNFDPEAETPTGFAGFQRKFVWSKKQMDRFIESLLLGYPVPGIFLVEQRDRTYLVLDGQQRLRTLQAFKKGTYGPAGEEKVFRLNSVADDFRNLTYKDLKDADRRLLDNTFIQATVVVPKGQQGRQGVYQLFERINSSGTNLQPQEIRVALYAGPRIELLRRLNHAPSWRALFGAPHSRLKDNELILRHLSLIPVAEALRIYNWDPDQARAALPKDSRAVYRAPMGSFVNGYLELGADGLDADETYSRFEATCRALLNAGGPEALKLSGRQVNAAHTDAILTALSLAPPQRRDDTTHIAYALAELASNEDYLGAISGSTSHASSVNTRLRLATEAID